MENQHDVSSHWKWVVVIASFVAGFIGLGTVTSTGLFYVAWLEYFQQGSGLTAWIGSMVIAFISLLGPVSGMATSRWGFRKVMMLSGLVVALGLGGSSFAPNVYILMVTYGFITGVGCGLMQPVIATIAIWYFETNCGLALGIASSGVGLGSFAMPMVIERLIQAYGWRGALLILAGLNLNICVCGTLMRSRQNMPHKQRNGHRSVAHLEVFKMPTFLLHLVHHFLFSVAMSVVFVHLIAVIEKATGVQGFQSSMTMVVYGIANFIGKFLHGLVANTGKIDLITQYCVSYIILGICLLIIPQFVIRGVLLFIVFILGMAAAPWGTLLQLVVKEIVGRDRMMAAYGYSWFSAGLGFLLGAPVAGWLFDYSQSYSTSLYFGGSSVMLSVLFMTKFWINRCRFPKHRVIPRTAETPGAVKKNETKCNAIRNDHELIVAYEIHCTSMTSVCSADDNKE